MGETLAETRVAIEAKRAELDLTSEQLRDALDVRKRFRENPVPFVLAGAGVVFIVVGGPGRVVGLVRRRFFPTDPEKAYDSLPKPMQTWIDHMTDRLGPRTGEARHVLAEELMRWRSDRAARQDQQEACEADRRGSARPEAGRVAGVRGRRRGHHRRPGA